MDKPLNIAAVALISSILILNCSFAAPKGGAIWTDPELAGKENSDFHVQGEYRGELVIGDQKLTTGIQVIALGEGKFIAAVFEGGLPGQEATRASCTYVRASRSGSKLIFANALRGASFSIERNAGVFSIDGKKAGAADKVTRKSKTLGAKPPAGAVILFDGTDASLKQWNNGMLDGKLLQEGCSTKQKFGSFRLHMEFRLPYKPGTLPSSQDRGNSGVYTFNRYETQLLDSFGLHYADGDKTAWRNRFAADFGTNPKSDRTQWCACFYKFKMPDVNVCYPPLVWQTYDIEFTAPGFKDGKKITNARFTTYHNGVKVHNNVELPKGTGAGGGRKEVAREAIYIQGHGNPVRFRNIWIVPKD